MPTDLVSRINLDLLYPEFLAKLLELLAKCKEKGHRYVATHGFRSDKEQAKLYFQGRTQPGPIVTNARPGLSCHNYGLAVDVVADVSPKEGLQPDWREKAYLPLRAEGELLDLQVGVSGLSDFGHVQLPLRMKLNQDERLIITALKDLKTIPAAWSLLTSLGPW